MPGTFEEGNMWTWTIVVEVLALAVGASVRTE